jgi:hypothetical protein
VCLALIALAVSGCGRAAKPTFVDTLRGTYQGVGTNMLNLIYPGEDEVTEQALDNTALVATVRPGTSRISQRQSRERPGARDARQRYARASSRGPTEGSERGLLSRMSRKATPR